jgi:hypothetical protein
MSDTQEASPVMAFTRAAAKARVQQLEPALNEHLVKILGAIAPEPTRAGWRKEARAWLGRIGRIGLRPDGRLPAARDLLKWLWEEPFGLVEERNVAAILRGVAEDFPRNDRTPAEIATLLEGFHRTAAARLARGEDVADLIEGLGR